MIISHNILAMNANRQLNITENKKAKSTEKLSSGYRINRSADDAAGLAISEKMRRQIRGLTQASRNCQDGVSLVQIADGALNEIHDMLNRGTELSIKAANGTLSDDDRNMIQLEIEQLKNEIDSISSKTTFNEIPVLKGSSAQVINGGAAVVQGSLPSFVINKSPSLQTGHLDSVTTISGNTLISGKIDFSDVNASNISQLDGTGFHMSCATCDRCYSIQFTTGPSSVTQSGSHSIYNVSIDGITNATGLVQRILSQTGNGNPGNHYTKLKAGQPATQLIAYDNRTEVASSNRSQNQAASAFAPGVAYAATQVPAENFDLYIQAGAESDQQIGIKLPAISSYLLGISAANVTTTSGAESAIDYFKNALSYVSGERSRMGSYQNRLEHTINNLNNVVENTTDAESRIRDTDMATEMVNFSTQNIISQAGQSMLSQANQSNQGVMNLLNQ